MWRMSKAPLALLVLSFAPLALLLLPRGALAVRTRTHDHAGSAAGSQVLSNADAGFEAKTLDGIGAMVAGTKAGNVSLLESFRSADNMAWRVVVRSYRLPFLVGLGYHTETWLCAVGVEWCYSIGFGTNGAHAYYFRNESGDAPTFFGDQSLKPTRHEMGVVDMSWDDMRSLMEHMHSCGNWRGQDYSFLKHNCNSFTQALLRGLGIPDDRHPRVLASRLEQKWWGNGRFSGWWSVADGRCSGNKCQKGTVSSCHTPCEWSAPNLLPGFPAQCVGRDGQDVVMASDFAFHSCEWSVPMLPVQQFRDKILKDLPSLSQCWGKFPTDKEGRVAREEACCESSGVDQSYCSHLTCLGNSARIRDFSLCCHKNGGWMNCLRQTPDDDKCKETNEMLASRAGLHPWEYV